MLISASSKTLRGEMSSSSGLNQAVFGYVSLLEPTTTILVKIILTLASPGGPTPPRTPWTPGLSPGGEINAGTKPTVGLTSNRELGFESGEGA